MLERLSKAAILGIFRCPPLLALVLASYGDVLYTTGFPLGSYRQLLAHAQRLVPLLKPHLGVAWDMVSRWEEVEPVSHRVPMPWVSTLPCSAMGLMIRFRRPVTGSGGCALHIPATTAKASVTAPLQLRYTLCYSSVTPPIQLRPSSVTAPLHPPLQLRDTLR